MAMFARPMPTSRAHPAHSGWALSPVAVSMVIFVAQMKAKSMATTISPRTIFTMDFILMPWLVLQNQANRWLICWGVAIFVFYSLESAPHMSLSLSVEKKLPLLRLSTLMV